MWNSQNISGIGCHLFNPRKGIAFKPVTAYPERRNGVTRTIVDLIAPDGSQDQVSGGEAESIPAILKSAAAILTGRGAPMEFREGDPEFDTWEVVQYAGMDEEQTVHVALTYEAAHQWIGRTYYEGEVDELKVDVLCNGSTEY